MFDLLFHSCRVPRKFLYVRLFGKLSTLKFHVSVFDVDSSEVAQQEKPFTLRNQLHSFHFWMWIMGIRT